MGASVMKRILFVDDEPNVLEGLRRMLRTQRGEWEMTFVESGSAALAELAREPYDVVVSDMRMPGMDGAQLLTEVMRRYPRIVRIILSGHSDQEMILRSVGPTHQYLTKPCDAQELRDTIGRAGALRNWLHGDALMSVVSQIHSLPSLPDLYLEIVQELQSPEASLQKVGAIISKDIGMTAQILHVVNSAFFGLRRHISHPAQAASLLGLVTVKALVLSVQLFSRFDTVAFPGFTCQALWNHCLATGALAKRLAAQQAAGPKTTDYAFMAGLLHDAGKLVLAANLSQKYSEALRIAGARAIPLWQAERETFGSTHAEVGAYLLGLWGLPDPIVEAVALHHTPRQCLGVGFGALTAVHVADALDHESRLPEAEPGAGQLDTEYVADLGLAPRLETWRQWCRGALAPGGNGG
jgi:HD-like signal output (HDOD) protein